MLAKQDLQIAKLIKQEEARIKTGLNLIASENYPSQAVREAAASLLIAKYAEGYPGKRYYSGMQFIDQIECIAIERAKKLFQAQYANVQPHSGAQANQAVYMALLQPHDKVLAMERNSGGHLTHGSDFNYSGLTYDFRFYSVDQKTQQLDYDQIENLALQIKPNLIVCGASSYPRTIDFEKFSKIAAKANSLLMADIAHIAGLIVTSQHPHCFPYVDVATSTTHKTLRGPRGGLILAKAQFAGALNKAVFPGLQGGPMMQTIAAKAVCFKEAQTSQFKKYAKQIILNAQALAATLQKQGLSLVSGGTDNHLVLIDLRPLGLDGQKAQDLLESVNIYANKNSIPFDQQPASKSSGLRLGTPALTTQGYREKDMEIIGQVIAQLLKNKINKNQALKIVKQIVRKK